MHTILTYILITVEVICSILLLGVILIQRTKSQGMGLAFGGAMGESIFGAQMGNVLTRTTVVLAITFLVTTTLLAMLGAREAGDGSVVDGAPAPAAAPLPAGPTPGGPVDTAAQGAGTTPDAAIPAGPTLPSPPVEEPAKAAPADPAPPPPAE